MGGKKGNRHILCLTLGALLGGTASADERIMGGSGEHFFTSYSWSGFSLSGLSGYSFKPSCLKRNGLQLLVMDPGHDDTPVSRRSNARVRGGGSGLQYLWPKIHEGQLNAAVSWMAFETILRDPSLSNSERNELRSMIRFTRYPGEKTFGQFESGEGYYSSTQGKIDSGVTNRDTRATTMMQKHRAYTGSGSRPWSASFSNVQDQSVLIAVHANSSDYFNEGDVTWLIRPASVPGGYSSFINAFRKTFSRFLTPLTDVSGGDSSDVKNIKVGLRPSFAEGRISTSAHPKSLRMLGSGVGSSRTLKMLTEGFVMNGKAGNLARRQLESESMKISFNHKGARQTYLVSDVYIQYARSIAAGIGEAYGCN